MVNITDLQEVEVMLPGDWQREDNGDVYSFTADKMEMRDERLFKQMTIRYAVPATDPPVAPSIQTLQWALAIKDDYCAIIAGDDEFVIREIGEKEGKMRMVWEEASGPAIISFVKVHA